MSGYQGISERILEFIRERRLSKSEFERRCHFSNGYLNAVGDRISDQKLDNISQAFPELNRNWLLYGEGEMIDCGESAIGAENYGYNNEGPLRFMQDGQYGGTLPRVRANDLSIMIETMMEQIRIKDTTIYELKKKLEEKDKKLEEKQAEIDGLYKKLLEKSTEAREK